MNDAVWKNDDDEKEEDRLALETQAMAQKLLQYKSLQQALWDRGEESSTKTVRFSQELIKDVLRVVRFYTLHPEQPPIESCLPRELSRILHTLVLPTKEEEDDDESNNDHVTEIPSHALDAVLEACVLTLRQHAIDAGLDDDDDGNDDNSGDHLSARLTLDDARKARLLLEKLQNVRVYTTRPRTKAQIQRQSQSMTMALNHVLQLFAQLALRQATLDGTDAGRRVVQAAEHLLIDVGSSSPDTAEESAAASSVTTRLNLRPDVVSFNTVMSAWAKSTSAKSKHALAAAERAEAILGLLMELHVPTSYSYEAVLPAWSRVYEPEAAVRAMRLLHDMMERHELNPQHPAPSDRTLVLVSKALSRDPTRLTEHVQQLERIRESYSDGAMSTILLNAVLNAFGTSSPKSPKDYYYICQDMIQYMEDAFGTSSPPDKVTFQTVLSSLAICAQRLGKKERDMVIQCGIQARKYLEMAQAYDVADIHMYNDALMASRLDVAHCEGLFGQMRQTSMSDAISCRYMMEAYELGTRTRQTSIPQRAEDLLTEMEQEGETSQHMRPETTIYNAAISAWVATKTIEGVKRADSILQRLCSRYENRLEQLRQDPDEYFITERPNTTSFIAVMRGYSQHGKQPDRVEELLRQMEDLQLARAQAPAAMGKKMAPVEPNTIAYNIVLDNLAQNGKVRKAEDLLKRMKSVLVAKHRPDTFSYQALLKAYAASKAPVTKTIQLLDLAKKVDKRDKSNIVNTRLYNSALNAIVQSCRTEEAAELAEDLLEEMETRQDGRPCSPDRVSRSTVMKAWTQVGTLDGISRAEDHLQLLVRESPKLSSSARVDTVCFNTILSAYSKLAQSSPALADVARDQTKKLFRQMQELRQQGSSGVEPDTFSYNCVMELASPEDASTLLRDMVNNTNSDSYSKCAPDSWTFSTVIKLWFNSGDAEKAAHRADEALRLKDTLPHLEPNLVDYNTVMKLWGQNEQPHKAAALLDELWAKFVKTKNSKHKSIQPDSVSYNTVLTGFFRDGSLEAAVAAMEVLGNMETRYSEGQAKVKPDARAYK